jgi:hypothetical protein
MSTEPRFDPIVQPFNCPAADFPGSAGKIIPSRHTSLSSPLSYRQRELLQAGLAGAALLFEEFKRFPDLVVEGCGGHLVLFRPRKILEPAAFPRFHDEVRTLARLFPGEMQIP